MKTPKLIICSFICLSFNLSAQNSKYVDPFIGTAGMGQGFSYPRIPT